MVDFKDIQNPVTGLMAQRLKVLAALLWEQKVQHPYQKTCEYNYFLLQGIHHSPLVSMAPAQK